MKTVYPEIRIKNGWLIYQNVSVHLHKLWGKNKRLATIKDVDNKVAAYQTAWSKQETTILEGMYKLTGLRFKQNIIDVYIAPWFSAFSDPMVLGIRYEPDRFVDVLTHELLHRLLSDNTKIGKLDLLKAWKKLFGKNHNFETLVHIPVLALHKAIILDILKKPNLLERDIAKMKEHKAIDYIKSWDYVNQHDYKDLIKQLLGLYKIRK